MERFIRLNILKSFLVKEFKQLFRDPRMRIVIFAPPIINILLFGYATITDVKDVRMAVMDEDRTALSRGFVEKFTASGYFLPYKYVESTKDATPLLDGGEVEVFLHMEKGFSRRLKTGKVSCLQIIVDGTDSSRAAVIVAYVNQITSDYSFAYLGNSVRSSVLSKNIQMVRFRDSVNLKERILFNPDLSSRNFFLSGLLGLLIGIVTISMTSMSIVKERESGTMEQIIVSPLRPMELIAGKTIPVTVISLVDVLIIFVVVLFWFKVPFNGNFFFLIFASLIYIFTTNAVGLYISTISRTQQQSILATFLYFLPSILLSGFIFPIYAMPDTIQYVTLINPLRYYVDITRAVFLKGVGIDYLWKEVLAMIILGCLLFGFSARRISRGME